MNFCTHVFLNNPHWQRSEIIILLWEYYIVISNTLVGCLLDVLFLLLAIILSELHEKPRKNKDWVTEKSTFLKKVQKESTGIICVRDITFLTARPPFYNVFFVAYFVYSLPLPKWDTCWITSIKILNIAMSVWWYHE